MACQASLSITNSWSLPKLMSIESGMPSNHLILCRPLLLLPSIFPNIRVFSNESALCIRWPKYWNFSFNISPSNELPGLISFKMNWLDLLAVQGTLKSLLQHHLQKHQFLCNKLHSNLPSITDYTVAPTPFPTPWDAPKHIAYTLLDVFLLAFPGHFLWIQSSVYLINWFTHWFS